MITFHELFEAMPQAVGAAPGRINLIGEHTDYNGGLVLPTVIPLQTTVEVAKTSGSWVEVATVEGARVHKAGFNLDRTSSSGGWVDYPLGMTRALHEQTGAVGGYSALVRSTLPWGAGLSSSAALLVAFGRALRELFKLDLADLQLAELAHRAEVEFVGAPVGIMDSMAASLGAPKSALFIDAQTRALERIPLPACDLVVIDSGVRHQHAIGGYRTRRSECARACELLGLSSLRELKDLGQLELLPSTLQRRVRHVFKENERVLRTVEALKRRDLTTVGAALHASHLSLKDDFEVSVPAIDAIVEAALAQEGVYGARLTGGGFGGAAIILTKASKGPHVARLTLERLLGKGVHGVKVLLTGEEAH